MTMPYKRAFWAAIEIVNQIQNMFSKTCRISASLVDCGSRPRSPGRGETGDDCLVLVLQCRVHGAESHAVVVLFPHL